MSYKKLVFFLLVPLIVISTGLSGTETKLQRLYDALIEIAEEHKQDPSKPVPLVAIGGCPGVGKTYFTKNLLADLQESGVHCTTLSLDHFNLSPQERRNIGTEWDIRHFKVKELHDCLASILSGRKCIHKPTINQITGEMGAEVLILDNINLILFDGLYSLCSKPPLNFFDYCSAGIFLEAAESDVTAWKWERELKKKQPRTPEQFAKHMEVLLLDYRQNIEYSKKDADFIIRKNSDHNYELEAS